MRLWIDTDAGENPDDTIALWCASKAIDVDLAGVSVTGGDQELRRMFVRQLLPGVNVVEGAPPPEQLASVDVLLGIGPWTNVARLADEGALPLRVVLMGGALAPVKHRGELRRIEHNVGSDPEAAARLLNSTGDLIVVPLDATARVHAHERDEKLLTEVIPGLREQVDVWRQVYGDEPLPLHDVASLLIALGDRIARMESRRLEILPDGTMWASVAGPLQNVVAHVNNEATRARMRELVSEGG